MIEALLPCLQFMSKSRLEKQGLLLVSILLFGNLRITYKLKIFEISFVIEK